MRTQLVQYVARTSVHSNREEVLLQESESASNVAWCPVVIDPVVINHRYGAARAQKKEVNSKRTKT